MPWWTITFLQLCLTAFGLILIVFAAKGQPLDLRHDSPNVGDGDYPILHPESGGSFGIEHELPDDWPTDHIELGRRTIH